jgi:hypothetical protein
VAGRLIRFSRRSAEVRAIPPPPLRLVLLAATAIALVVVAARAPGGPADVGAQAAAVAPARAAAIDRGTADVATVRAPRALATRSGIAAAQRYARSRAGTVAFAVLDGRGRLRGLNRSVQYPSASVVKAMLMVAVLRRAGAGRLDGATARTLTAMITVSDNDAASAIYRRVGGAGLRAVARAAHARRFADVGWWASARLTAADQARFFYNVDRLVPAAHRRFARRLLSSIVGWQRWGIPPVAARHGMKAFFKGGWRTGITHQVALLEKDGRRLALAVFTSGEPSMAYGERTIAGIAARVLR